MSMTPVEGAKPTKPIIRLAWFVHRQTALLLVLYGLLVVLQVLAIISPRFAWLGGHPELAGALVASVIFTARSIVVNRWFLGALASVMFLFHGILFEADPAVALVLTRIASYAVIVTWGVVGWALYFGSHVDLPDS
jgi:hypothetical protein